jgi:hypothetical protein
VSYESADMPKGHCVRSLAVVFACCAAGCGGGAPLLHPAHVLPAGKVSAGAGVSGQFAFRGGQGAGASTAPEQHAFEDAIARASLSPGIAPWVGARAGLGGHFEMGLTYTGRSARADARRAFGGETVAVSVGAAASAVFSDPQDRVDDGMAPAPMGRLPASGGDLRATGYGFDVPVLVGWRSTASVVQGWLGARGGFERIDGNLPFPPVGMERAPFASFSATRWYGGGLVGAAVGLWPVTVAVELDVTYQGVSGNASFPQQAGNPRQRDGSVSGLTLAPAGAIIGKF